MKADELWNKVYDLLIEIGGASAVERSDFVYAHINTECHEWRFCGKLDFGGKFWREKFKVTCYSEDVTPNITLTMDILNNRLAELHKQVENQDANH